MGHCAKHRADRNRAVRNRNVTCDSGTVANPVPPVPRQNGNGHPRADRRFEDAPDGLLPGGRRASFLAREGTPAKNSTPAAIKHRPAISNFLAKMRHVIWHHLMPQRGVQLLRRNGSKPGFYFHQRAFLPFGKLKGAARADGEGPPPWEGLLLSAQPGPNANAPPAISPRGRSRSMAAMP